MGLSNLIMPNPSASMRRTVPEMKCSDLKIYLTIIVFLFGFSMSVARWQRRLEYTGRRQFQSSSASRVTAGAGGFLIFSQLTTRSDWYAEPKRFDTIPLATELARVPIDDRAAIGVMLVEGNAVDLPAQQLCQ